MACTILLRSINGAKYVIQKCNKTVNNTSRNVQLYSRVLRNSTTSAKTLHNAPAFYFSSQVKSVEEHSQKKKKIGPKITLIGIDESMSVTSLEDAEKLAKRRDLKLVKIIDIDTKSQRPIYKLMTGSQFFEQDLKQRKLKAENRKREIKGEKLVSISSKISEHDLQSRLKNITKWLEKNYEARVVISYGSNKDESEKIFNAIQDYVKDHGHVVQRQQRSTEIKFRILPLKKSEVQPPPQET